MKIIAKICSIVGILLGVVGIILNCTIVFNIKGILFGAVAIIVGVGVLQMSSLYDDGKDDF